MKIFLVQTCPSIAELQEMNRSFSRRSCLCRCNRLLVMTDKSKITLRWEFENASQLTPGTMESAVLNERGFEWLILPRPSVTGLTEFYLVCENKLRCWRCKANLEFV
ncbi:hypothetical protein PMAYCL1PPCAC_25497, partial [Pristionchus mayeri]